MTGIEPRQAHTCQTPGSLRPQSGWPMGVTFDLVHHWQARALTGTLWQCHTCERWWYAAGPPNPPGGPYPGGGRVWRPVRWYHRAMRRRIRKYDFNWGGNLVANKVIGAGQRCPRGTSARTWVGKVSFRLPTVLPAFCIGAGFRDPDVSIAGAAAFALLMER